MSALAIQPKRGRKVHILKPIPARPLPQPGNGTVWLTKCGRHVFGVVRTWAEVDESTLCKRCAT